MRLETSLGVSPFPFVAGGREVYVDYLAVGHTGGLCRRLAQKWSSG